MTNDAITNLRRRRSFVIASFVMSFRRFAAAVAGPYASAIFRRRSFSCFRVFVAWVFFAPSRLRG
jgi:hypothetical protein